MREIKGLDIETPKKLLADNGISPENSTFTYHDALRAFELGRQSVKPEIESFKDMDLS